MKNNSNDNPKPPKRSEIKTGEAVWIIEKEHYGTQNFKQGIVKKILTSKNFHSRGIKVKLTDDSVGRVQWKVED